MSKFDELVKKLKEIFQIDKPELDFGVYRILNARAGEISDFLEKGLKAKVFESLQTAGAANSEAITRELKEKEAQLRDLGVNPDTAPKIIELRQRLNSLTGGASDHENATYSHLLTFFSRYYDNGDFISQRRYKGDTYAIPYSGEEVMLHWANKDQYYTKSGESFSNYAFKLEDGRSVVFRLLAADTAKDNRKDNDKERRFVLIEPHTRILHDEEGEEFEQDYTPVQEVNGELVIYFDYKAVQKGTKQEDLVAKAVKTILEDEAVKTRWLALSTREPTEKNPNRTLLEKALTGYTTKNTADYFIHKDLGGFLRRELDFYIKNEVMNLDDVSRAEKFADIEKNLRLIQTLRAIAQELIIFLAQLEDFQKKLWLKKKFVVATHYCFTLDHVPETLFDKIVENDKQWQQWITLGMLEKSVSKTLNTLKNHKFLMVDTALFDARFKAALLGSIQNLDEKLDGLLIHGDNFQALNLLQTRYREQVKCIYIDPPYNTSASEIAYKNSFKHSSWLSLIDNRIELSKRFLKDTTGLFCCTIDDAEFKVLSLLIEQQFQELAGTVAIRIKPSGRPIPNGFAVSHEYAIFARSDNSTAIARLPHSEEQKARYRDRDEKGIFFWEMLRKAGSNSNRENRPTMYYPFYLNKTNGIIRLPNMSYDENSQKYTILEQHNSNESVIYPIKDDLSDGCWYFGVERAANIVSELKSSLDDSNNYRIYYRRRQNEGAQPTTNWFDSKYSATEHGTALLKSLFGEQESFSYPKSIFAVIDCLSVMGANSTKSALVLDYFAGSGTTGHAVISLNREDNGTRKYILVEQGDYFDTVLKPRLQKVVYSAEWKEGKATAPKTGISHAFKVLKMESYEDTLNNLALKRTKGQQDLLDTNKNLKEDYLLRYMLDIESQGSLLSLDDFISPFDYKLKIAVDSAGAYETRSIDLVETFNYLIGLKVSHIDTRLERGYVTIYGTLPTGEKTLVLWRDVKRIGYEALNDICKKLAINPQDSKYDVVYMNGDHTIPTSFTALESEGGITKTLKIRQIEAEFLNLMFEGDSN